MMQTREREELCVCVREMLALVPHLFTVTIFMSEHYTVSCLVLKSVSVFCFVSVESTGIIVAV